MSAENHELPVAVVTGAGGAVGAATVKALAADHIVFAMGRTQESLDSLRQLENVHTLTADLQDLVEVEAAAERLNGDLTENFGRVKALVHAAAVGPAHRLEDCDATLWQQTMAVNVSAPALLTRGLLPSLRAGEASVVFVNSGAGQRSFPDHTAYAASKHALRSVADSLRLGEPKLKVTTVSPGQIDSKMLRGINQHLGRAFEAERYIRPESVAETIRWAIHSSPDLQITNVDVRPRHEI